MTPRGSAAQLGARRRLAVTRINQGWKHKDAAEFLGTSIKAVGKWMAAYRSAGQDGLAGKPHPGPKPKLSARQEEAVLAWLASSPEAFGYTTRLRTTRRLAEVIARKYGVRFNSNYLAAWLTARGQSPQKPEVVAVERDHVEVARWAAEDWPRLEKEPGTSAHTSS